MDTNDAGFVVLGSCQSPIGLGGNFMWEPTVRQLETGGTEQSHLDDFGAKSLCTIRGYVFSQHNRWLAPKVFIARYSNWFIMTLKNVPKVEFD